MSWILAKERAELQPFPSQRLYCTASYIKSYKGTVPSVGPHHVHLHSPSHLPQNLVSLTTWAGKSPMGVPCGISAEGFLGPMPAFHLGGCSVRMQEWAQPSPPGTEATSGTYKAEQEWEPPATVDLNGQLPCPRAHCVEAQSQARSARKHSIQRVACGPGNKAYSARFRTREGPANHSHAVKHQGYLESSPPYAQGY